MGFFFACFCPRTQTAKLLDTDGCLIGKVMLPAKVAELMLENPGHVIAPADELRKTGRISAMKADDELLGGKVYVLMAARRIRSKVSESEMKKIEIACKNKVRKSGSKVRPTMAEEVREETKDGIDDTSDSGFSGLEMGCFQGNKRWIPDLQTISEDFSVSFKEK